MSEHTKGPRFLNRQRHMCEYPQREELIDELKTQLDELLEALEEIEWSNNEQWRTERARTAIAKAKGK